MQNVILRIAFYYSSENMPKARNELRILLLQIRDNPKVRAEEHQSFAEYGGLQPAQISILNVFDTPEFPPEVVLGYDAVLVGGASEASVLEPHVYPFIRPSEALLRFCAEHNMPVFASCFGFQLVVTAFGGDILRDAADFEMGTSNILLNDAGKEDILLHDISNGFPAISVHRERATSLPDNCVALAYTKPCIHALRVKDKPFWAFQFHPEVDKPTLVERLTIFKAHYTRDDAHLDAVLTSAEDTPECNDLVKKFIDRVVMPRS